MVVFMMDETGVMLLPAGIRPAGKAFGVIADKPKASVATFLAYFTQFFALTEPL
jgi:hypothetical protein